MSILLNSSRVRNLPVEYFSTEDAGISHSGGFDAFVKALLHFNGADTSTTFTDETGKTWTANGNAQLDTAQQKFGTASGLFDGSGDYVDTPDHADFALGSGDFTIDFWVRRGNQGSLTRIAGQMDSTASASTVSFGLSFLADNTINFVVAESTTLYSALSTGTITQDSTWHHVACLRDGNTLRIFIDGVEDGTLDVTGVTINNSANKPTIGRLGELPAYYTGHIDEFRFSVGIARWTSNFTPPTSEYF